MRYPKLRELKEAITALIKGPYTSMYPARPHVAAEGFRGRPEPSENCIGCTACAQVCPARAIEVREREVEGRATRQMVWHLDECHYCGQCELQCTTRSQNPPGVRLTQTYELAAFSRSGLVSQSSEKELIKCEICSEIVTTRVHLEWTAKRLGTLAFSNPTLFVSELGGIGLSDKTDGASGEVTRADRLRILCAKCRRATSQEK